jgi:glycosyltransferase involved in cell wall biosynthesis
MTELVSCILVTKNRVRFFQQALRRFLQQRYLNSELIVVDDGEDRVESYCRGLDRVRYIRLCQATNTGAKLNIGAEAARGTLLQKLDDDDYYGPEFLNMTVGNLARPDRAGCLVAWDCFLILLAGEKHFRFSGHGWRAGGTLCFTRELWARTPFRDVPKSSDRFFFEDARPRLIRVCAPEQYILVRHGTNTWTRMQGGLEADDFLRTLPRWPRGFADIMDGPDQVFYQGLSPKRMDSTD